MYAKVLIILMVKIFTSYLFNVISYSVALSYYTHIFVEKQTETSNIITVIIPKIIIIQNSSNDPSEKQFESERWARSERRGHISPCLGPSQRTRDPVDFTSLFIMYRTNLCFTFYVFKPYSRFETACLFTHLQIYSSYSFVWIRLQCEYLWHREAIFHCCGSCEYFIRR